MANDPVRQHLTPLAVKAFTLAGKKADRLKNNYVGTEHILLGLMEVRKGRAVEVLKRLGLNLKAVKEAILKNTGKGPRPSIFSPIPQRVLKLATQEAETSGHTYVGTEHILLGVLRDGDGGVARVLRRMNVTAEKVRQENLKLDVEAKPKGV